MHAYVVKNIDDFPVWLEFTDGSGTLLRPNATFVWQGSRNSDSLLQPHVDAGRLSVWTIGCDPSGESVPQQVIDFEWREDGF